MEAVSNVYIIAPSWPHSETSIALKHWAIRIV